METYDTHNIRDPLAAVVDPETGVVYVLVGYLPEVSVGFCCCEEGPFG